MQYLSIHFYVTVYVGHQFFQVKELFLPLPGIAVSKVVSVGHQQDVLSKQLRLLLKLFPQKPGPRQCQCACVLWWMFTIFKINEITASTCIFLRTCQAVFLDLTHTLTRITRTHFFIDSCFIIIKYCLLVLISIWKRITGNKVMFQIKKKKKKRS